jgi:hypothetical protein
MGYAERRSRALWVWLWAARGWTKFLLVVRLVQRPGSAARLRGAVWRWLVHRPDKRLARERVEILAKQIQPQAARGHPGHGARPDQARRDAQPAAADAPRPAGAEATVMDAARWPTGSATVRPERALFDDPEKERVQLGYTPPMRIVRVELPAKEREEYEAKIARLESELTRAKERVANLKPAKWQIDQTALLSTKAERLARALREAETRASTAETEVKTLSTWRSASDIVKTSLCPWTRVCACRGTATIGRVRFDYAAARVSLQLDPPVCDVCGRPFLKVGAPHDPA